MARAAHGAGPASPAPSTAVVVGDSPDDHGHANKAPKLHENAGQHMQDHDWISAIPDEMLIYVLTLMPMKDAAIMGCVSTRWRHLWRQIPNLILNEHSVGMQQPQNPDPQTLSWFQLHDTRAAEFIVKVNSILRQRHGTRIELFVVKFPLNSRHAPEVDRWAARAAEYSHAQLHQFYVEYCPNLETISIHAEKLYEFAYIGHMADMVYTNAPVLHTVKIQFTICSWMTGNECPLDCIGALPSLKILHLQFTSSSMHSLALQHYQTFARLKEVMLSFLTPWNESILLVAYFLIATPLLARLQLEAYGTLQHPKNLSITWPEHVTLARLQRVIIGGFSGESELMELTSFLLRRSPALKMLKIYTHPLESQGGQK